MTVSLPGAAHPSTLPTGAAVASWRSPEATWQVAATTHLVPAAQVGHAARAAVAAPGLPTVFALPFDPDGTALMLTATAEAPDPARREVAPVRLRPRAADASAQHYRRAVNTVLERIGSSPLQKAVLAREVVFAAEQPLDADAVFAALCAAHPATFRFRIPLPEGGSLLGASPELLLAKRGRSIRSHPLAGSAARVSDLAGDERAARALQASEKDQREHRLVVEAIADQLSPYCRTLNVPRSPALVATHTLWHLGTWISGELKDPDLDSATLATALHPTPAVGGTPQREALRSIHELEDFERGYYAGAVGWTDAVGDGEWAVAIRCARVEEQYVTAYAGAGIVAGSEADHEVAETSTKMRAFLEAVGKVVA